MEPDFELTEKNTEENGLGDIWTRFSRYWPLLLFLTLICCGAAWVYLQLRAPLYEAKATVLIKDEKKGVDESKMVEGFNQLSGTKIIENEIEVIGSRSLMAEVVKKLRLYAPVFTEGKWRPYSAYITSPVRIEMKDPSKIRETDKINFTFDKDQSKIIIGIDSFQLNQWVETKYGTLRFIPNNLADSINLRPFYFSLLNPKRVTTDQMKRLQVNSSNKLSTVIDLRIVEPVAELSEDILNTLISTYDKAAIKDKNILADSTLSFLDERLKHVSRELDSIEKRTQVYRSDKDVIDIGSQGKLFLENVSANDQKVSEMNMQLAVLDEVEKYVRSKDALSEIAPSALVVNDPLLSQRLEKLYLAEMEYEKLKQNTAPNNPLLISVTNQIDRIKPGVLESIRNQKKSLEAGKNNLNTTNGKYNTLLQTVPQKERELIEF
ncbi:MAG: Wzz/FepE/Etk N-terminal domain-containing protein, partial [Bacteroidota bacterium]